MSEEKRSSEGQDPLVGSVLADRYRIDRRLGEGGMGVVYRARHVILEKVVALKVLHGDYSRRRDLVERFLHEAKAASRIRHEHVIDITDFGETHDHNVFFAMEYLEGRDLGSELRGGLAWPRAKSIMLQICSALEAAHEAGVIHRDLKPANVYLIERLGRPDFVKVLDFGVAKLIDEAADSRQLTKTGMVIGTAEYMSPEQAKGEKPDTRIDVYACGCILFEMVTGDVPFRADSFMGVMTKQLLDKVPRIRDRTARTDLPAGLQDVLDQALAKDRDQRFGTMNELAVAIDTLDEIEGVSYRAPGTVERERARSGGGTTPTSTPRPVQPAPSPPRVAAPPPLPSLSSLPVSPPSALPTLDGPVPVQLRPSTPPPRFEYEVQPDTSLSTSVLMDVARLPRRGPSRLVIGAAVAVALAAAFGLTLMSERPRVTPATTEAVREPSPAATPTPTAVTPPTAPAPPPAPEPDPAPPAPEPAPAAAPPPEPAPAAAPPPPEPTPEPAAVAPAPPPKPAAPVKRTERPKRTREHRTRERRPPAVRIAPIPPLISPKPEPAAAPPPAPTKKSDLKDPFKK